MKVILILDNIRSAYNVGSLLRTADGFGIKQVVSIGITPHMNQLNDSRLPHVINKTETRIAKTALGAERLMDLHFTDSNRFLKWAKSQELHLVSLELDKRAIDITSYKPANTLIGLILGNEVNGVNVELLNRSNEILQIPMFGKKESFNVSVSGAIAIYILSLK